MGSLLQKAAQSGWKSALCLAFERFGEKALHTFDRQWQRLQTGPRELQGQRLHQPECGMLSVLIPVWNTRPEWLEELAGSLMSQTLENWEAVLMDGCSTDPDTLRALEELPRKDSRLRAAHVRENRGISGNTNAAAALARGTWLVFCDHDDLLQPDALWRLADAAQRQEADVLYTDEDRVTADGKTHFAPAFKPDFCPDDLLGCNYLCHLTAVRRELYEKLGGLRPAYDGCQDHDLMLRCMTGGARFVHIPRIMYHWRDAGTSMSHEHREKCLRRMVQAVQDHLERTGQPGKAEECGDAVRVRYELPAEVRVCLLLTARSGQEAAPVAEAFRRGGFDRLTVRELICGGNRAEALRKAAACATEELILLWDASLMPAGGQVVEELASLAWRRGTGAAMPRVLDRHGRIACSGYAFRPDGQAVPRAAGHHPGCMGRMSMERIVHEVSAVSTLCAMVRREDAQMLTDDPVQWSLALREAGRRTVVTPFAQAVCRRWEEHPQKLREPLRESCIHQKMMETKMFGREKNG